MTKKWRDITHKSTQLDRDISMLQKFANEGQMGELTLRGTVRNIVSTRNFGFIKGNNGPEYFFHRDDFNGFWNDLVKDCADGSAIPVTFEDVPSPKGPRAKNVKRTDHPN